MGIQSDVSNLADLDRLYVTIKQEQGRLDVIFANAGTGELMPLGSITEEHFDKTFKTNVKGLLFTVQKALPLMTNGASIILNASTTSIRGTPAFSVYSASKAAVRSFARNWILDLKDRQIRVNVVSPGTVPTPAYSRLGLNEEQVKEFVKSEANNIPLGSKIKLITISRIGNDLYLGTIDINDVGFVVGDFLFCRTFKRWQPH